MDKDISNEQLFGFMSQMYIEMQEGFKELGNEVKELKNELKEAKNKVILMEQEHGKKLDALFDGYRQNSDKLDRIAEEVSKHEEIILRRLSRNIQT